MAYNADKAREVFDPAKRKIQSPEQMLDAFIECGLTENLPEKNAAGRWEGAFRIPSRWIQSPNPSTAAFMTPMMYTPPARFWILREWIRAALGIYQPLPMDALTPLMTGEMVSFLRATGAHMSSEPGMVAYTSSIEDGERDARHRVSLAKLLRKVPEAWRFGDETFAGIQTAFVSELSSELTILPASDIWMAYEFGPRSCMQERNLEKYWKRTNTGVHVTEPYNAPGWGCAVIESGTDDEGNTTYSQRALVWVNPDNPSDKRFIRVYGSGPLERRLRRNGYNCSSAVGARLKAVPAAERGARWYDETYNTPTGATVYVVPYIDGAGGPNQGESVRADAEAGYLRIISSYDRNELTGQFGPGAAAHGSVTHGLVVLLPASSLRDEYVDCLDGETKQRTRNVKPCEVITAVDGDNLTIGMTNPSTATAAIIERRVRSGVRTATSTGLYALMSVPVFDSHDGRATVVDTPSCRESYGFVKLDPELYPDAGWVHNSETRVMARGETMRVVRRSDLLLLVDPAPTEDNPHAVSTREVHTSELTPTERRQYVKIRSAQGYATLRRKTLTPVPVVRRSGNVWESIPGLHRDIVKAIGGAWLKTTDVAANGRMLDGRSYHVPVGARAPRRMNRYNFDLGNFERWGASSWQGATIEERMAAHVAFNALTMIGCGVPSPRQFARSIYDLSINDVPSNCWEAAAWAGQAVVDAIKAEWVAAIEHAKAQGIADMCSDLARRGLYGPPMTERVALTTDAVPEVPPVPASAALTNAVADLVAYAQTAVQAATQPISQPEVEQTLTILA